MYNYLYPRPALTCDIILLEPNLQGKILLIKRGNEPFKNTWALPGGFLEMEENLETCALRELKEETDITLSELTQFKTYGDPDRDPRGRTITVVYYALLDDSVDAFAGDDATEAQWFSINKLPDLAFDHSSIIADFLSCRKLITQ